MARAKSDEEKRKRKTELQRLRRLKIRNQPEAYEQEKMKERQRWKKRVDSGKIKKIGDLSRREQKAKRKVWTESARKYRFKKREEKIVEQRFINDNTPPSSPRVTPSTSRHSVGRKRVRKDRAKAYRTICALKTDLFFAKKAQAKYKAKYYRLKSSLKKNDSPNTVLKKTLKNNQVPAAIKKTLLLFEVLKKQVSRNYESFRSRREKAISRKLLSGKIKKIYKLKREIASIINKKQISDQIRRRNIKKYDKALARKLALTIENFFEKDMNSRLCPGKNDTVTRNGLKKQKRLLNKPLKVLHRDFMKEHNTLCSYAYFCKNRPFWVVFPNINKRDTCLCTLCENIDLLVKKMKIFSMVTSGTGEDLIKSRCCPEVTRRCLERKCTDCIQREVQFQEFNGTDTVTYSKWISKTERVCVSGKEKECKKVIKAEIRSNKYEMYSSLISSIDEYMQHIANKNHQYTAIQHIKKNMKETEILLHMDFSENYVCKYAKEIQSMHFGGSKEQAVLHTLVVYYKKEDKLYHKSICTITENSRKDPIAIMAHLRPVFEDLLKLVPNLTQMHFLSDAPSTQYRNYKMFYLLRNEFSKILGPNLEALTWNYSEKGHGKGAPDGVGGCLKRVADTLVALGEDIPNVSTLVNSLRQNFRNIKIIHLSNEHMSSYMNVLIVPEKIQRFKGALKMHQLTFSKQSPYMYFRRLTCIECQPHEECTHFGLGKIQLENPDHRLRYQDVYSDSEDEEEKENRSPETICVGDFILVKFQAKKSIKYYAGLVLSIENEIEVKFLRKAKNLYFVFPDINDIATIEKKDVEKKLEYPVIDKRGHHFFKPSLFLNYQVA